MTPPPITTTRACFGKTFSEDPDIGPHNTHVRRGVERCAAAPRSIRPRAALEAPPHRPMLAAEEVVAVVLPLGKMDPGVPTQSQRA